MVVTIHADVAWVSCDNLNRRQSKDITEFFKADSKHIETAGSGTHLDLDPGLHRDSDGLACLHTKGAKTLVFSV
jgi:hypothetical protein